MCGSLKAIVEAKAALSAARSTIKELRSARKHATRLLNCDDELQATRQALEDHSQLLSLLNETLMGGQTLTKEAQASS